MVQSKKTKRSKPTRLRASPKRPRQSRRTIHKQRRSHRHHGGNSTYTFDSDDRLVAREVRDIIDDDSFPRQQRELIQHYPQLIKTINRNVSELVMSKLATNDPSQSQKYDTQIKSTIQNILKGFILARERAKTIANLIIDKRERKESRSAFGRLTHSLKKRISGTRSGKTLNELEQELETLMPDETIRENFIKNLRERRTMEKQVAESRRISEIMSQPLESSRRIPRSSVTSISHRPPRSSRR